MPSPAIAAQVADVPVVPPAAALLAWYDRHRRSLPWRAAPGETADPYRVWLSEIMLQQTTARAVISYYERFLTRFPTVKALAEAEPDAVMRAWAGLGYYARARNLHACARTVAAGGGRFPRDIARLRALPGIGTYTAAAIAAIAFDIPAIPVDGNVERVAARVFAVTAPLPSAKPAIAAAAAALGTDPDARARASDFAQSLFDLGATICTPTNPLCTLCPWCGPCAARRLGIAATLPARAAKAARPVRHGTVFWLIDARGQVLLRRRPPSGLLGGMIELPGTAWGISPLTAADAVAAAPMRAAWRHAGEVRHVFTHFELRLAVYAASVATIAADRPEFLCNINSLDAEALPSVMRKCVAIARGAAVRTGLDE